MLFPALVSPWALESILSQSPLLSHYVSKRSHQGRHIPSVHLSAFPTPQPNATFYFEFPLSSLTMLADTCRPIQQNVSRNAGCRAPPCACVLDARPLNPSLVTRVCIPQVGCQLSLIYLPQVALCCSLRGCCCRIPVPIPYTRRWKSSSLPFI